MSVKKDGFKSGFIALIGRPNVGKSTMVNTLVGKKVAIVADKPQTTRNRVSAVVNVEGAQLVFIDTPGIHKPSHALGEYMVDQAKDTMDEVDLVLFVLDATAPSHSADKKVREYFRQTKTPVWIVLNKCDLAQSDMVESTLAGIADVEQFEKVIRISALTGLGMGELTDEILKVIPHGPQYYPDDIITDHPEKFIVAEFIREKLINYTREEIPHSVAVDIDSMEKRADKDIVDISANIYVERESQKGIVIGNGGSMLKKVSTDARLDIERLLGSKVNLKVWVKVKKDWRDDTSMLTRLGYE